MKQVPCPRCGQPALFAPENKWRPFCSQRCKIIDLGDWASERFRVPAEDQKPGDEPEDEKN